MSDLVTHESNLASLQNMPPIQPKFIPAQKTKVISSQKPVIKENHVVSISIEQVVLVSTIFLGDFLHWRVC